MSKYDEDVFDWKMRRTLMNPSPEEKVCEHCQEKSIYVDEFDAGYRHAQMDYTPIIVCIDCYTYMIVSPMDDMWSEYYSSIL